MKTISIKLLLVLLIFNLTSCKNENSSSSLSEYKYSDQPQTINCPDADNKLLNEALYAFEDDIINFYDVQQKNAIRAYSSFLRDVGTNRMSYDKFVSEHSVNLATILKQTNVFNNDGLNYNHDIIKCIAKNMNEDDLKITFNALLSTNSMSKSLYKPALNGGASKIAKDKHLSLYIALEYFYAELIKSDFSKIDFKKRDEEKAKQAKEIEAKKANQVRPLQPKNTKVDFNKRPAK
ncbi:hypothetical protein ACFS5M_11465 [Lacinutrix iliipiscaria]|uniref:Lipoprotein n=1 Tax=Lacinutrix iliipiscaria TaxID=1230532 RepID=A0ABW5WSZ6_9FLAO